MLLSLNIFTSNDDETQVKFSSLFLKNTIPFSGGSRKFFQGGHYEI